MTLILSARPCDPANRTILLRLPKRAGGGVIRVDIQPDQKNTSMVRVYLDLPPDVDVIRAAVLPKMGVTEEQFAEHAPGTERPRRLPAPEAIEPEREPRSA